MVMDFKVGVEFAAVDLFCYGAKGDCNMRMTVIAWR
jgi:hypothetical protein